MRRVTIKGLLAHKLRFALTALAVVLGVAFVAGTFVLTDTIRHTFDRFFADVTAGTDVSVRARSGFDGDQRGGGPFGGDRPPVPTSLVDAVAGLPGVEAAEGTLLGFAQLVGRDGRVVAGAGPTIATAWVTSEVLNPFRLRAGREPRADGEVVIDAATAKANRFVVGDQVRVLSQGAPRHFRVVGVAGFGDADKLAGVTLVAFDEETARRVLHRPDGFDTIEVAAEPGVSQVELRRRVVAAVGPGLEVVTGQAAARESAERVKQDLGFFGILLLVFAGVSLFVGAFLILNTFQILVAQRTRELGLLRALGASAAQVRASVLAEAAAVGAVASAVGLGVGVVVAVALQALLRRAGVDLPAAETQFLPRTAVVSVSVGTLVTVASALLPARRASRIPPVVAIRDDAEPSERGPSLRLRTIVGLVVSAVGLVVLLAGTAGAGNGAAVVGLGAVVGFVGASLVAPAVARPAARVIGAPFARMGFAGKLGRQNAMRNPRRTAATAAALMVGLALVTLVSIFAASARKSTSRVIDEVFTADFVMTGGERLGGFSPELPRRLRLVPEVETVAELRQGEWRYRGQQEWLTAADPADLAAVLDLEMTAGSIEALAGGGVLVHEDEAEDKGLRVGDVVPMSFARTGTRPVPVRGIFAAKELTGDYVVSLSDYEANFSDQLDSLALVKLREGRPPAAARAAVERVARDHANVEVRDQEELKDEIAGQVDDILNLFYALLGLAVLIALLGIVNTLALSVFERTRELGLLRAVGTSRRQVRSMVRVEGAIIAVFGAVLGLVIGALVASAMLQALRDEGITVTAVPFARLAAFVAMAGMAGMGAALLPARRASRLDVLQAIAHE